MSSHREAPEIAKDPVCDSTDVYAFVSPERPNTVTLIANYVPLQAPDGGPNFYEFGNMVMYDIHIDLTGDAKPDITYRFEFDSVNTNPKTFLYNTGPITISGGTLNLNNWNRRQYCTVTKILHKPSGDVSTVLATNLACPPCNVGVLSTPNYADPSADGNGGPEPFTKAFIHGLPSGETVFTGQRAEAFFVDLGAIFDLGQIRPLQGAHFGGVMDGLPSVNSTSAVNVHSIAIQIPKKAIFGNTVPTDPNSRAAVIGVYTTASRRHVRVYSSSPDSVTPDNSSGAWTQVSRMANPLFNEVLVPLDKKDLWNITPPYLDSRFAKGVTNPELAQLLPILYSPAGDGVNTAFPHLAALNAKVTAGTAARSELAAVLLTGIPAAVGVGVQNYTGPTQADLLRLNTAVAPTPTSDAKFSNLGVVGGDIAGFPNGRRVYDDVTTVELKAIAGALYPLIDPTYTPDAAVGIVDQYLTADNQTPSGDGNNGKDLTAKGSVKLLTSFPYLGTPHNGYKVPSTTPPNDVVI